MDNIHNHIPIPSSQILQLDKSTCLDSEDGGTLYRLGLCVAREEKRVNICHEVLGKWLPLNFWREDGWRGNKRPYASKHNLRFLSH
jgi:hypothetical protein